MFHYHPSTYDGNKKSFTKFNIYNKINKWLNIIKILYLLSKLQNTVSQLHF